MLYSSPIQILILEIMRVDDMGHGGASSVLIWKPLQVIVSIKTLYWQQQTSLT